jgi:hypothetical protein
LFLAAILYQQTSRTTDEQRVVSLNVAKALVIGLSLAVITLAVFAMLGVSIGGEA